MSLLVLVAAFVSVFMMGLNSKILRDDYIMAGAVTSWLITISQYAMTWAVVHAGLSSPVYIFWAGVGGSAGITAAQYAYAWMDNHKLPLLGKRQNVRARFRPPQADTDL